MPRNKPPFRADVVGSILRTAPLKEARAKREKGEITAAQLKEVEDREIEKIIKKQEEVGLQCATDGEFRRSWWHFDFYGMLDGVEIHEIDHGIQFQGVQTQHAQPAHHRQARLLRQPSDARAFQVSQGAHARHAENVHPEPRRRMHFRLEPNADRHQGICRPRRHLRRSGEDLPPGDPRLLRRRLPLSADRRHRLGLSVLAGRAEKGARPRAERRQSAAKTTPASSTARSKASRRI